MQDTIHVNLPGVKMVAHRGVSGLERENTCAAFVAAGNRSYFGVETDIHRTADGRYIVFHDDNLTRLLGDGRVVEEMRFDELRALRLTDLDGNARGDLLLPTLEEYVHICKKYDKDCVLEIKNHFEPEDIDNVIAIIRGIGWLERTIFISFDLPNMICIRERLPQQRAQYLVSTFGDDLLDILTGHHLDLDIKYSSLSAEQVRACHEAGIQVNVWTVNEAADAERLAGYGVDFITSNILE
ncbi:MAG: glycerophosphodiester phosphodiesterase [Candidatus Ventricola sp.]